MDVYAQKLGLATLGDGVKKDLSCPFVYEDGRVNPHDQSVLRAFRHWGSLNGSSVMADWEMLARKRRQQRRRPWRFLW